MRETHSRIIIDSEQEAGNSPGWLVTFNDLITLLMVFFVLLFAMSNINAQKSEKLVGSLQSALGVLLEGKKTAVQVVGPVQLPAQEVSDSDTLADAGFSQETRQAIDDLAGHPDISVIQTPQGMSLTLSDSILFQSGVSELRSEGYPVLNKIIPILQNNRFAVRIEGHTDNVSIRNVRFPSNWELSVARAVHVLKYFIDIGKIEPQRLSAVGYGDSKPVYPNDSPANREKNRRVEIILEMMDL
jgi:chemotaxis protein MotB